MTDQLDPQLAEQMEQAVHQLRRAVETEKAGTAAKKRVKEETLPLMSSFDIEKYKVEGIGTIFRKSGGGSSIDQNKLTELLLNEGIGADRVGELIDEAKNRWTYEYLEFRPQNK